MKTSRSRWHGLDHRHKMEIKREERLKRRQTFMDEFKRQGHIAEFVKGWKSLRARKGIGRPIAIRQSQITPNKETTDEA